MRGSPTRHSRPRSLLDPVLAAVTPRVDAIPAEGVRFSV
jgi:hypothetical protein